MTNPVKTKKYDDILVINIDSPPVNALSQAVRQGIIGGITEAQDDTSVVAVILICSGRTFIAGADISEFGMPPLAPSLPEVLQNLSYCRKPIVSALHGTVLGGGLETAMSCDYRVAAQGTKVGLPEVSLGLIPGSGGTQLLPRLVGISDALEMITSGKQVAVESELGHKLVDDIFDSETQEHLLGLTLNFTRALIDRNATVTNLRDIELEKSFDHDALFAGWRQNIESCRPGVMAPQNAIDAVENAVLLPFADALKEERRLFLQCLNSNQSRALRYAFLAERECVKIDGLNTKVEAQSVLTVGVIGAGLMGTGIAMCFADAGIPVSILEIDEKLVAAGIERIRGNYQKSVDRGRITRKDLENRLKIIVGTTDYKDLSDADLVVEAASESTEVKLKIFTTLEEVCRPDAILATNTSYLDINHIANAIQYKDRVLGMHFFSPANIMRLLEIVRAENTSSKALATAIEVGKRIKKTIVTVGVCYGFVGNRMYARYSSEAQNLLLEGATPRQVDSAMLEWGMAMGPFQVVDMTGLDIGYKARKEQPNLPDDPKYFILSTVFVEEGRIGQKSGAGFYNYVSGTKQNDEYAIALIRETAAKLGVKSVPTDSKKIQTRLISSLFEEGKKILAEGIVQRPSDIDVIWLNGYGFPRHKGGPLWYTNEIGL
jgi:3-hydroxyacyl-CoA dehydrogenase